MRGLGAQVRVRRAFSRAGCDFGCWRWWSRDPQRLPWVLGRPVGVLGAVGPPLCCRPLAVRPRGVTGRPTRGGDSFWTSQGSSRWRPAAPRNSRFCAADAASSRRRPTWLHPVGPFLRQSVRRPPGPRPHADACPPTSFTAGQGGEPCLAAPRFGSSPERGLGPCQQYWTGRVYAPPAPVREKRRAHQLVPLKAGVRRPAPGPPGRGACDGGRPLVPPRRRGDALRLELNQAWVVGPPCRR